MIYKKWEAQSVKAVLLLIHGLGAHSGRWEFLANFLRPNGISSYTLELRGYGESKDLKGHIDSFNIYLNDLRSLLQKIRKENPGKKIFVAGESAGALLGILIAFAEPDFFQGLIGLSPAFKDKLKFSFWQYIKIYSSLLYNPKKQFRLPFDSAMCTRDAAYVKIMENDPREHRLATSRLLFETRKAQENAMSLAVNLKLPILFLVAGSDQIVEAAATRQVFQSLKTPDKELIEYPEMHHSLSVELGKEKVFADILSWLEKRL